MAAGDPFKRYIMTTQEQIKQVADEIAAAPPAIASAWTAFLAIQKQISAGSPLSLNLMQVVNDDPRFLAAIEYVAPLVGKLAALIILEQTETLTH